MAFYSFVVIAEYPVGIPKPLIILDRGQNVFSAEVSNLEEFKAYLENESVVIKEVNRLDAPEPGGLEDFRVDDSEDLAKLLLSF